MASITFCIALILGIAAITRRSGGSAIGILVFSMLIWPEYLRFSIGVAEISATAFIALMLLIKSYLSNNKHLILNKIDILVISTWIWIVIANLLTNSPSAQVIQMIGRGLDTVLIYLVVRYQVANEEDFRNLCLWLGLTAIIMCSLGIYENIKGYSPYTPLTAYKGWQWIVKEDSFRLGLKRANVSTSVHIYFGMTMMMIFGLLISLRGYINGQRNQLLYISTALMATLTSLSSGPWLACILVFGIIFLFEKRINLIKPTIYLLVIVAATIEIISNRHFYNLIDYIALDSQTAWYRTRLLEIGLSNWREYWLLGVGSEWPHNWAEQLDGRDHIDIVNYYLILALYGGFGAVITYILSHYFALKFALAKFINTQSFPIKKLIFGLCATLIALDFSSLSVGLFGPVLIMSHILLAILVSTSQINVGQPSNI